MTSESIAHEKSGATSESLLDNIRTLASDEFEGRQPGTRGEQRTINYLKDECLKIGLQPGACDGTYFQTIPVLGYKALPSLRFHGPKGNLHGLSFPEDYVAMARHRKERVTVEESDVVFVGYGIVAPEYGWNDYKNVDVRGKTVLMLIGQPQRSDPQAPGTVDESFFRGNALTYYGRWTYKYEIASELGASAVFIIHETKPAGYGYDVVTASWSGENFDLGMHESRVDVEGWLELGTAKRLFELGGLDFDRLKAEALKQEFSPVPLNLKANITVSNTIREFESSNVIAKLEGADPELKDECIIYSAHWDHFGTIELNGRTEVYSGALDNASGVAIVMELAKCLVKTSPPPKRSILFFFTTLEESGLLGAQYYVRNPAVSIEKTVAIINMDIMNVWGKTREIVSIALGHSSLDRILEKFADRQERKVVPDPEPEKGYFFRSDHLEFLRKGVPSLFFLHPGSDYVGKSPDFGARKRKEYLTYDYHKVTDKVKTDWDLSGTIDDVDLLLQVGLELAQSHERPIWNPASEFAPKRTPASI